MIRETLLSTAMIDEDEFTEPPSGMLRVTVIADVAYLDWAPTDQVGEWTTPPTCSFQVSARSLLLALRAAWDDNHPGVAAIDHAEPAPARDRGPRPPSSHQPWTPELDAQLRDTWLAATTTSPAPAMIAEIAEAMGRSRNGIRARLARLGCDPDIPGRTIPADDQLRRL
jgi:hypothetical protein